MLSPSSTIPAAHPTTYVPRGANTPRLIFHDHFPAFAQSYDSLYAQDCGTFRLQGIAHIQCTNPGCRAEFFPPFSYKVFYPLGGPLHRLCPSSEAHPSVRRIPRRASPPQPPAPTVPFFHPQSPPNLLPDRDLHYMDEIAVCDLQHRMREVLESAVSGATVVIKKRGKPIARYQAAAKMTDKKTDFNALIVANCEADDRNLRMALIPFFGIAFKPRTPSRMPARSKTIRWAHPSSGTMTGSSATDTGR